NAGTKQEIIILERKLKSNRKRQTEADDQVYISMWANEDSQAIISTEGKIEDIPPKDSSEPSPAQSLTLIFAIVGASVGVGLVSAGGLFVYKKKNASPFSYAKNPTQTMQKAAAESSSSNLSH